MFTHSLKFFKAEKLKEILPQLSNEMEEGKTKTFYEVINIKNWALEYNIEIEKDGIFKIRELLENCEEKSPDILYDFVGTIFIKIEPDDKWHKIESNTFSKFFPLYKFLDPYNSIKFSVTGKISFKIAVLDASTKSYISIFDSPFNEDYILRYYRYKNKLSFLENKNYGAKALNYRDEITKLFSSSD